MPAYHKGPRQDIIDILYNNGVAGGMTGILHTAFIIRQSDPVLQGIRYNNLKIIRTRRSR